MARLREVLMPSTAAAAASSNISTMNSNNSISNIKSKIGTTVLGHSLHLKDPLLQYAAATHIHTRTPFQSIVYPHFLVVVVAGLSS